MSGWVGPGHVALVAGECVRFGGFTGGDAGLVDAVRGAAAGAFAEFGCLECGDGVVSVVADAVGAAPVPGGGGVGVPGGDGGVAVFAAAEHVDAVAGEVVGGVLIFVADDRCDVVEDGDRHGGSVLSGLGLEVAVAGLAGDGCLGEGGGGDPDAAGAGAGGGDQGGAAPRPGRAPAAGARTWRRWGRGRWWVTSRSSCRI